MYTKIVIEMTIQLTQQLYVVWFSINESAVPHHHVEHSACARQTAAVYFFPTITFDAHIQFVYYNLRNRCNHHCI